MLVAVWSPVRHGGGTSTLTLMLTMGVGRMKKKALALQTSSVSASFNVFLSDSKITKESSSPTQMVKLLRESALSPNALSDYCVPLYDNAYAFVNDTISFDMKDYIELVDCFNTQTDFDVVFCDVEQTRNEVADYVFEKAEAVVINVTQSVVELNAFKQALTKLQPILEGKKVIIVCNKYTSVAGNVKKIAKAMGLKAPVYVLHYNPWIVHMCNSGKLPILYGEVLAKNKVVGELGGDISRLASNIIKLRTAKLKEVQSKRIAELYRGARKFEEEERVPTAVDALEDAITDKSQRQEGQEGGD